MQKVMMLIRKSLCVWRVFDPANKDSLWIFGETMSFAMLKAKCVFGVARRFASEGLGLALLKSGL